MGSWLHPTFLINNISAFPINSYGINGSEDVIIPIPSRAVTQRRAVDADVEGTFLRAKMVLNCNDWRAHPG